MQMEYSFYGELRADLSQAGGFAPASGTEYVARFFEGISREQKEARREKAASGRCMSADRYQALTYGALEAASRLGLDLTADVRDGVGVVTLVAPHITFCRDDEPIPAEDLVALVSAADRMSLSIVEKYGEHLVQLALSYDLDE